MKITRKALSVIMALVLAMSAFAVSASAIEFTYTHPTNIPGVDRIYELAGGTSYATATKIAPGETVYATFADDEAAAADAAEEGTEEAKEYVAYYAVNTGSATRLVFEFKASVAAKLTIIPEGATSLAERNYPAADKPAEESYKDTFDVASGKYYYIIVKASEECEYTFTTATNAILDSKNEIITPSVDINKSAVTLYATESFDIDLTNAKPTLLNYYWEVRDNEKTPMIDETKIITVSQNGVVTVARNSKDFNSGSITAEVRAYVYYNNEVYWKTCTITALPANLNINPYFDSSAENCLLLGIGGKQTIKYSTSVKNAKIVWTSKDESIAKVNVFGTDANIVGVAEGSTEVYADVCIKDASGNYTDKIARRTIRVDVSSTYSQVTGVELSDAALSMRVGNSKTLTYKVVHVPANILPDNTKVKFTSSNPAVAKVNDAGVIEAVAEGTATITVTTEDGGYTAKCEVTVKAALPNWLTILIAPFEIIYNLIRMLMGK